MYAQRRQLRQTLLSAYPPSLLLFFLTKQILVLVGWHCVQEILCQCSCGWAWLCDLVLANDIPGVALWSFWEWLLKG